jgi:hypothetical protein
MTLVYIPGEPCPCGCGATGSKLSFKTGHIVRSCTCRSCIGRRNRKKGQAAEAKRHRMLGGEGQTIRDDLHHAYSLNVSVEDKSGSQCPVKLVSGMQSEFMRRAFSQATRKIPVGSDAYPAVMLHPHGGGAYLLVDCSRKELR